MKKFSAILIGAIALVTCSLFVVKNLAKQKLAENPAFPYDRFAEIRSYPDAEFDIKAYESSLKSSFLQHKSATAQASTPWQQEGPTNIGGRITCLAVSPTNSNVVFIGTPGAGIFKTTNGGNNWVPVFDDKPSLYIGYIAFDPNNANTLYAGTGDPSVPFTVFIGDGIYKSTDAGATWSNIGLASTKIISKIIVSPTNSNEIYVAALGNPIIEDANRGVYKSTNAGATWNKILFVNNQTGISDIVMNPTNNSEIYAAAYTCVRNATVNLRYSNDARIYKTTNAGANWNILLNGLPNFKVNKYSICMSKQSANKLYVAVSDSTYNMYAVYKTTNGGANFTNMGNTGIENNYGGFGWYFNEIAVSPTNDEHVYISGVELFKSTDGGASWNLNMPNWWNYIVHADIHTINFTGTGAYYLGTDGGTYFTNDDGANYTDIDEIPNTQFYRVDYNPHQPTEYWGGAQDNGTSKGNAASISNWSREFGGDGFQMRFDPADPNTFYVETQNGNIYVTTDGGSSFNNHVGNINSLDRRNWDMPYVLNSANSNVQYTGTYRVYKNTGGPFENWTAISNDLTDGLILDPRFHTISAIDNSKLSAQKIYVGTTDANVWVTLNDGGSWTNITGSLPNRYVTSVHASPNVANNVYVTHTGYKYNEYIPHIHKSTDNGTTWVDISGNLPQIGINDMLVLPSNENTLFVATDNGVYVTYNGGIAWARVGNNMPLISVWDIEYNPVNGRLIAGTYAKSLQTIDVSAITTSVKNTTQSIDDFAKIYPSVIENGFFTIDLAAQGANLSIVDAGGKTVKTQTQLVSGKNKISVNDLSNGLYFVRIQTDSKPLVKRIVISQR